MLPYSYNLCPIQVRRIAHAPKARICCIIQVQRCITFNDGSRVEDDDSVIECDSSESMRDTETGN